MTKSDQSSRLFFADCEIDLAAFQIRRGGTPCDVEPQVFDLISYFARNPDRLINKDELVAEVWGGRIVSDAALSSRIKSARRALGDDGTQQRLIKTVHGRGFRFLGDVRVEPAPATAETVVGGGQVHNLRQEIRFCRSSDGTRLAYATGGNGPVLIKTANWLSHLDFDLESPVWRHWIAALSERHTLIRYDARCNGLSDWDVADVSLDVLVDDLAAVIDASGHDRVPLLCISQGCAVGAAYAARHPDRVSRMIMFGGYARGWALRGDPAALARREALSALINVGWGQDNPVFRQVFTTLFMPGAEPHQAQWYNELQRRSASPENARRLNDAYGWLDVRDQLPKIKAPTLVLHVKGDEVVPFEEGRILATEIPGARFVPLDGVNHILIENEPAWCQFLGAALAFLNETS